MVKKFYEFKQQSNDVCDLYIFGDITSWKWDDSDVGAFDLSKELKQIDSPINVHINSYGGEVKEGLAIYNILKDFKHEVTTICEGFACSAASIIFMAGSKRVMPQSSLLMIHNAWTTAQGDSNDLLKAAEDLKKITQPSIEIYKGSSNLSEEEIKAMMDAETWITAEEALSYGFATHTNKDSAKQSLHDSYLQKAILKNKELEERLSNSTQAIEETPEQKNLLFLFEKL